jgi:hypothetical protein
MGGAFDGMGGAFDGIGGAFDGIGGAFDGMGGAFYARAGAVALSDGTDTGACGASVAPLLCAGALDGAFLVTRTGS